MLPVLFALPVSPASAQIKILGYSYSTEDTYTDNVNLAPAGSPRQRTAWTSDVRPTVTVGSAGSGLRLNATYSPQLLYRVNEKTQDIHHNLTATGAAELVRQTLFLNASAGVSQVNTSLLGPQSDSNVNTTGNRTSVRTFSLSPRLRPNFGPEVQGEGSVSYSRASYESANGGINNAQTAQVNGSSSESRGVALRLASGPAFKLNTWSVGYTGNRTESSQNSAVSTSETITAGGKRLITSTLGLIANVGYQKAGNSLAGAGGVSNSQGKTWSTGLDWSPSPITHLAATTGRTSYGTTTYSFDFSHRTPLSVWSAGYNESITTTHAQSLRPDTVSTASVLDPLFVANFPDPIAREKAVKDYIAQNGLAQNVSFARSFLTDQTFLTKQLNMSAGIIGKRNTVTATISRTKSQSDSITGGLSGAGDFASSSTVSTTGATLNWTTRITQFTTSNASASYTLTEFPGAGVGREDTMKSFRVGVSQRMLPHLFGSMNLRRTKSDSTLSGAGYTENAVVATLRLSY